MTFFDNLFQKISEKQLGSTNESEISSNENPEETYYNGNRKETSTEQRGTERKLRGKNGKTRKSNKTEEEQESESEDGYSSSENYTINESLKMKTRKLEDKIKHTQWSKNKWKQRHKLSDNMIKSLKKEFNEFAESFQKEQKPKINLMDPFARVEGEF